MKSLTLAILACILCGCATDHGRLVHDALEMTDLRIARGVAGPRLQAVIPTDYQVRKAKQTHRRANPRCVVCGAKSNITNGNRNDVHHIIPVHVAPVRAADPDILITLCRRHHFWIGHGGNWRTYNVRVRATARAVHEAVKQNAKIKD